LPNSSIISPIPTPIFNGRNGDKKVAKILSIATSLLIRKYKFGLCTFTAT